MNYAPLSDQAKAQIRLERAAREAEARQFHGRRGFASVALKALLSIESTTRYSDLERDKAEIARLAFDWADAMLAEEQSRYQEF